jgi:hypothetical protein
MLAWTRHTGRLSAVEDWQNEGATAPFLPSPLTLPGDNPSGAPVIPESDVSGESGGAPIHDDVPPILAVDAAFERR